MRYKIDNDKVRKSVRKQWDFNPVYRVVESKKEYSRKRKFRTDFHDWYVE